MNIHLFNYIIACPKYNCNIRLIKNLFFFIYLIFSETVICKPSVKSKKEEGRFSIKNRPSSFVKTMQYRCFAFLVNSELKKNLILTNEGFLVEPVGVEPTSKNQFPSASPSADAY